MVLKLGRFFCDTVIYQDRVRTSTTRNRARSPGRLFCGKLLPHFKTSIDTVSCALGTFPILYLETDIFLPFFFLYFIFLPFFFSALLCKKIVKRIIASFSYEPIICQGPFHCFLYSFIQLSLLNTVICPALGIQQGTI